MLLSHRRGFTLVELLVVIAMIGILVSMLLPAIQAAREAARRSQCLNRLSQIVLALHHYEMAHAVYPAGVIDDTGPIVNRAQGKHQGWLVQLLPYLEERNAANHVDWSVGVYHEKNKPVRELPIPVMICPSDAARGAHSNYAGCHHDVEAPIDAKNHGVLFLNSRLRYDDITDGCSHTIFVGERLRQSPATADLGWMSGTRATLRNTGTAMNLTDFPPLPPVTGLQDEINTEDDLRKLNRDISRKKSISPQGSPTFVGGFSSRHPGGANFAFGDGGVRYVPETISMDVYQALGHRSDGRLIKGWP